MRLGRLRFHVCQIHNGAVVIDKGRRQRQQGVLHPKALLLRLLKDKQHALVGGHVLAKHEANFTLLWGGSDLGINLKHARLQLNTGQIRLRLLRPCSKRQENKAKAQRDSGHGRVRVDG